MKKDQNSLTKSRASFEGALILMLANVVIKLVGAVFKIPLKNLIGGDGMGIYNTAYTPYAFLFLTIATAGIPIAVSRMVAEANALGKTSEIKRIFRVSLITSVVVGAVLSALMFVFAKPLSSRSPTRARSTRHDVCTGALFRLRRLGVPRVLPGHGEYGAHGGLAGY